jgi:hypothetical protein
VPGAPLRLGSGALLWRASDLANVMREALGHHVEVCFSARFCQEGTRREVPGAQEFITKAIEELQEARAMRGDHRPPPGAAPCPGEDSELRVCVNIPGLNRAASQERFWPSRAGRCEGPPHSYVRMPLGLPSAAVAFQHHMRGVLAAHEARSQAILSEEEMDPREPPGLLEPPEVQGLGGS